MMVLLLAGLALAAPAEPCAGPAEPYLADVAERGDETSYLCLVTTDAYLDPLVQAIQASPDGTAKTRYTRALALHLAARSQQPWNPDHVRLLNPADRRLLADAVKARRGRKSPSAEHDAVFQKQPWYRVDKAYTDNELTDVEKQNIAMADKPPPPAPPTPTPTPVEVAPAQSEPPRACGCDSGAAPVSAGAWLALALAWSRRRRPR